MEYILAFLEKGRDYVAGKLGITLMSGKIVLAIVLVVLGAMIVWDLFGIIFRNGKRGNSFRNLIAHGAAIAAIAELIKKAEYWVLRLVVDYLGIDNNSIATEIVFLLGGTIVIGVIVSFFVRKVTEFILGDNNRPEEKVLQGKLRRASEFVSYKGELTTEISIREGHNTLYFEWLSHYLTERYYRAKLTGSIEGRINLDRASVRIDRYHVESYDKTLVTVFIPSGYFQVNFDISDITDEINHSGFFSNYYTPQQVSTHFDKQCPDISRKFITDNGMLKKTKDSAREWFKETIMALLREMGFENVPGLREYKVEVEFTSHAWNIHRGASQNVIGTIQDQ